MTLFIRRQSQSCNITVKCLSDDFIGISSTSVPCSSEHASVSERHGCVIWILQLYWLFWRCFMNICPSPACLLWLGLALRTSVLCNLFIAGLFHRELVLIWNGLDWENKGIAFSLNALNMQFTICFLFRASKAILLKPHCSDETCFIFFHPILLWSAQTSVSAENRNKFCSS